MILLTELPPEILHAILVLVEPWDVAALNQSCTTLRSFVTANKKPLYKELYLQRFDDPRHRENAPEPAWEVELPRYAKLLRIFEAGTLEAKIGHLAFVCHAVEDLLLNSPVDGTTSRNITFLSKYFALRDENQDAFLCRSSLFERARPETSTASPPRTDDERQWSAKLHCLYGVPIECHGRTRSGWTYPYACSKVYDLRNYNDATLWGPFSNDGSGRVDWERLEAIMVVLGHNIQNFRNRAKGVLRPIWSKPFDGAYPKSFKSPVLTPPDTESDSVVKEHVSSLEAQDPFGITGTWFRVVCFLDYHELHAYNFGTQDPPEDVPREPLDVIEAIRLIVMSIRVTKIELPGEDDNQSYPVVHFKGSARSMHASWDPNANSTIRGTVRMTKEGEVRWTTFSIYGGEWRWRSESIQIGGLRSARGSFGNWYDKDHDPEGPAGPTAFWKISDDHELKDEDDNFVGNIDILSALG